MTPMRRLTILMVLAPALFAGCATHPDNGPAGTLAELRRVEPDLQEQTVGQGLDQAMQGYRRFLEETPETAKTPEAMRRLADLQLEKQFGIRAGDGKPREMAAPEAAVARAGAPRDTPAPAAWVAGTGLRESDAEFEQRTTGEGEVIGASLTGAARAEPDAEGPLEAIALYDRLLTEYPDYEHRDQVLYQKARAYDELGRTDEAIETMEHLIGADAYSEHYDEVQFRRGEYLFTRRHFREAETAYSAVTSLGAGSTYYELALYKLGWTFYKQELYEEAMHKYMALLDYKVSIGYDFDQEHAEEDERRVADTFRVISFSLNNLGGPSAVPEYFATFGNRSYEDRVYRNLGEHYLAKLRYDDAAKTYRAFVELYPYHRSAPQFSMRVVETFTEGGFPKLVLEAKREFAAEYGLQAEYWQRFTPEESPEVLAHLKSNLTDLATHYHAQYQETEEDDEKRAHYRDAQRWYGDYLESFPADADAPSINYQLADLLLEDEDFGAAAEQYGRTAYEYEPHPQAAAAGYAAVYANREQLKAAGDEQQELVRHETVANSLRFADAFPDHEHAAAVLGAAADDMYEMQDYGAAIESARRVLETYPDAEAGIRRSAWIVVAHGSFDLADYREAERAYGQVLSVTPEEDDSRAELVDNLAASIYKQGELASDAEDYRAAADHFLRVRAAAPTSAIRATAEYDAGAALVQLQDWTAAAGVLEEFRDTFPEHELQLEATRQIAYAYREEGQLSDAAEEYERMAAQSEDPAMRSEALLVAGDLYERSHARNRALDVYNRYVDEFPQPVETALETRVKIAGMYEAAGDASLHHQELEEIVRIDAEAGPERTGRTRTLAARSALVLAEQDYSDFLSVKLLQPFEISLQQKKQRMDDALGAMERLVEYEIADVTSAATYYIAETYLELSRALVASERPTELQPADLQEYELALDAEAYPFEEKAIDFHEENLELLQAGVFNEWTEKSLDKLADLVPGRYAKSELSSDVLGTIDRYVYRSPASLIHGPAPGSVEDEPAATMNQAPTTVDDGVVDHAQPQ